MSTRTALSRARGEVTRKPLVELLHRARRSKHITGENEPAETEAARTAYARLGKLAGR